MTRIKEVFTMSDRKELLKFDYEHFNYEACYKEVRNSVKKPNILICGATGVGKSSLVNDLLELPLDNAAEVGDEGVAKTRGVKCFTTESSTVNLYDSEGYEIGGERQEYYKNEIIGFIDKLIKDFPTEMEKHIHEVWYCVSAGNKRFFDVDHDLIEMIMERQVPVMIILTKVDEVEESELVSLYSEIKKKLPGISCFSYSVRIPDEEEFAEIRRQFVQREAILDWAVSHLDESLVSGFIPAMKSDIARKRDYILKRTVPKYAASAAAVVTGSSFISVPFTDSAALMPIQVKMAYDIIASYGIKAEIGQIVGNVVGTTAVSYLGRTVATQIIGLVPAAGGAVKTAVNVTVATSITAMLGSAITYLCEQYLKTCINNNGVHKMNFFEFFTPEKLSEALKYVSSHKKDFNVDINGSAAGDGGLDDGK